MSKKRKKNNSALKKVIKSVNSKRIAEVMIRTTFLQSSFDRKWEVNKEDRMMIENPMKRHKSPMVLFNFLAETPLTDDPFSKKQRQRLLDSNIINLSLPSSKVTFLTSELNKIFQPLWDSKVDLDKSLIVNIINESNLFDSNEKYDLHLFIRNIENVAIFIIFDDETFIDAKSRILLNIEAFLSGGVVKTYGGTKDVVVDTIKNSRILQSRQFIDYFISRYMTYAGYIDLDKFKKSIEDSYDDSITEERMKMVKNYTDYKNSLLSIPDVGEDK